VLWNITEHYDEADSSISHSDVSISVTTKMNLIRHMRNTTKCGKEKLSDPYAKYYSQVKHSAAEPTVLFRG
jgi:hypothetical protein